MSAPVLTFGNVPVPYTVSWSEEQGSFIGSCPHAGGRRAICQAESRGSGKPIFGKPHSQRQREVIANDLCDLCARPLKNRTKVSLSHARPQPHGANGWAVLQVEPLLHKECAATSMQHCPSLRRDIRNGTLMVRQVLRHRVQFAVMAPQYVAHYVPDYAVNPTDRIIGHAKVELLEWRERDEGWLSPSPNSHGGER